MSPLNGGKNNNCVLTLVVTQWQCRDEPVSGPAGEQLAVSCSVRFPSIKEE